jgi:hypothetical protein
LRGMSRTGCINAGRPAQNIPQRLKPQLLRRFCGTAKAVPFQNTIYATSSMQKDWAGGRESILRLPR